MRNITQQLTDKEIRNVLECLNLVLMEDFFEEWEFETLFGVERALYFKLKHSWFQKLNSALGVILLAIRQQDARVRDRAAR